MYVYYTATAPNIHNRVSRFTADGDVAMPGSEVAVLDLEPLSIATNHNGGAIHFGPDGKLYVAVGENANGSNSQSLGNRLGKILRINPDGSIPADNPFYTTSVGVNRAIWALGLRNPFTFAIQPSSGEMSSTMSARIRGKRSTRVWQARTTAGRTPRGTRTTLAFRARSMRTTIPADARSAAAPSTAR